MSEENPTGISATLKASEGFDAPWIVVHAQNVTELREMLLELGASDVMEGVAKLSESFKGNFEQKPRYQNNKGGWKNSTRSAQPSASAPPATVSASSAASSSPPPFVQNQQAQPAQWGQQQPVQQMQQQVGATVVAQAPNEVAFCADHGNAPREFKESFFNPRTQRQVSAMWACPVQGCKPYWAQQDGTWQRGK